MRCLAAKRELREETGLCAESWKRVGSLVLDENRGHAQAHVFLAEDTRLDGAPCPDETESLVLRFYSQSQLKVMVREGRIATLSAVAALLLALDHLDQSATREEH